MQRFKLFEISNLTEPDSPSENNNSLLQLLIGKNISSNKKIYLPEYEVITLNDLQMKKQDIQLGMVVEYRCGKKALVISVNDEVIHGIPSKKVILKDGDIISIETILFIFSLRLKFLLVWIKSQSIHQDFPQY